MTLNDFLTAVEFQITDGGSYGWPQWGRCFTITAGLNSDRGEASIVFSLTDQTVYEITAADYVKDRAYRWLNPTHAQALIDESQTRNVDYKEAWDLVNYISIDVESEILEKVAAIVSGRPYDDRVTVELDLDDKTLMQIALAAHERDITVNQYVEETLRNYISEVEKSNGGC